MSSKRITDTLTEQLHTLTERFRLDVGANPLRERFLLLFVFRYLSLRHHDERVRKVVSLESFLDIDSGQIGPAVISAISEVESLDKRMKGWCEAVESLFGSTARPESEGLRHLVVALMHIPFEKYVESNPSVFARAYAQLLDRIYGGSRSECQHLSPMNLGHLLASLLEPRVGDRIYDPVCGSGGFLAALGQYVMRRDVKAGDIRIFGREKFASACQLAKFNMIVNGFYAAQIQKSDIFVDTALRPSEAHDVVVANPPFSMANWMSPSARPYELEKQFIFGLPPKRNADFAFVQHVYNSLSEGGRAAIVVPSGVLFRGSVEGEIREKLVGANAVDAVIGLPAGLFHGTSIAANILIMRKDKSDDSIFFVSAEKFFTQSRGGVEMTAQMIEDLAQIYTERRCEAGVSAVARLKQVAANDFNLGIQRYIESSISTDVEPLADLNKKQKKLEERLFALQREADFLYS